MILSSGRLVFAWTAGHRLDCGAAILVAGRAEVEEILSLPQVFSVALYKPKMGEFMLALDGTEVNYRDKAVMRAVLSWRDLPAIRDLDGGREQLFLA